MVSVVGWVGNTYSFDDCVLVTARFYFMLCKTVGSTPLSRVDDT